MSAGTAQTDSPPPPPLIGNVSQRWPPFVAARPGGLDEFDLLVHYDLAWAYSSPVETLTFGFADSARIAVYRG